MRRRRRPSGGGCAPELPTPEPGPVFSKLVMLMTQPARVLRGRERPTSWRCAGRDRRTTPCVVQTPDEKLPTVPSKEFSRHWAAEGLVCIILRRAGMLDSCRLSCREAPWDSLHTHTPYLTTLIGT